MLVALAAIWGAAFLFIAIAVPALGAFGVAAARAGCAALALFAWARATRQVIRFKGRRADYLLLGLVNAGAPFVLISASELTIPASLAAIVNATAPLFSALIAAVWLGASLDRRQGAGLALGVLGVALVVGLAPISGDVTTLLAIAASLGAAALYGVGAHLVRRFAGEPALTVALGQTVAATAVTVPFLAVVPPRHAPSAGAIAAVLALGLLATGVAYVFYVRLIEEVGATSALTVTYLVPVFGVLWAALFRDEQITVGMVAGAAVVLAGVLLVTGAGRRRAAPAPPAAGRGPLPG
jgi:drug/metabolite transporter (DMT)-like permease